MKLNINDTRNKKDAGQVPYSYPASYSTNYIIFKIPFYLIAPSTIPCMICFCANKNRIMMGIMASGAADKIKSHCFT